MKRIVELDILRVLALLFVVFHHATWWFVDKYPGAREKLSFFFLGDLGVSFFIILSGCALTISGSKSCSFSTFYKKRFLSIIPSYWIAYLLVTVLLFSINGTFLQDFKLKKFLATFFAMDGWLSTAGFSTYYRVGEWFTGFILLIYAIAPLVISLVKKRPFLSIVFFTFISYLSIHYNDTIISSIKVWSRNPYWNPTARLAEFSIGVFLGLLILNNKIFKNCFALLFLSSLTSGVLLYLSNKYYYGLRLLFYVSLFISLLLIFNLIKNALSNSPKTKIIFKEFIPALTFCSSLSFLAFLFHHQITLLLMARLPPPSSSSGTSGAGVNLISYGVLVCSILCLSYTLAYFSLPLVNEIKRIAKRVLFLK